MAVDVRTVCNARKSPLRLPRALFNEFLFSWREVVNLAASVEPRLPLQLFHTRLHTPLPRHDLGVGEKDVLPGGGADAEVQPVTTIYPL